MLCSQHDAAALWAYQGLRKRGLLPLELVTAELLVQGCKWDHRVGSEDASITMTLADGRVISNKTVRGTLNRLTYVPMQTLAGAPDYEYATQEYAAFFMSWVYTLRDPVFNRSTAQGLSGSWRHASEWAALAAQAGLPTLPYKQTSEDTIDERLEMRRLVPADWPATLLITAGHRVVGDCESKEIRASCIRLAQLANTPLLGIELALDPTSKSLVFAGATPTPDLRIGGEALLDALAAELYKPKANGNS